MTLHYANNEAYRIKHRQLMRERYRKNLGHCTMTNMIAMKIKRKYKQMPKQAEERDDPLITEAISVFRTNVKISPTYVCTSCGKACFKNQVKPCIRSNYSKNPHIISQCLTGKYVHICDEGCINEQCKVPERRTENICHTCHNYLKNGSMPPLAVANKLELFDVPEELSDLNILERHLVAKCLPFAKIIPLPKGRQNLIRGNVVCVPSEVQETVEILPRLRSESQVLRVKLKRRLCYKGHQLFQNVTWSKLMRALKTLKQIHPQYQSVNIRDEAELCDPTLPDDEDDDVRMEDEDYDEADLMEIDMCEKVALTGAEHEANSEHDGEMNKPSEGKEHHERDDHDNDEQEGDMPNGGFALESCLQPCDVSEDIMSFSDGIYSVAPAERNSPISFFKTPKLEAMAFPVQFPTGLNTLDEQRQKKLTPSSYFKSRLFCIDDRFARDTTYLFFAQFVTEIYLANSSMSIQLRKGKAVTRDGRRITSSMLQDRDEVERLVRNKDAVRFMQPLRGTPAYWEKTTRDLFAMIRQLGTPTLFCTFSAGEFRWPEVIEAIKRQQGEEVDFKELDWSTKCDILRSNPVTAMRMFDKRVEALLRDLIFSPAQPLGKVIDFFYRVEFQHRGSPHIHCLFWVEGAPVFEKDDDKTVCDFVDKYISAQIPDQHKQPELYKKVTEVQKHSWKHTRTCFKTVNSGCRFGFPKPPCRNTMISRPFEEETENSLTMDAAKDKLRPLNLLLNKPESASMSLDQLLSQCSLTYSEYEACLHMISKSNTVILKRDPKDSWTNGYNPHLLKAWDSNIDISYILNAYSCVMYLTKYITKKEAGLSDYLKTVIESSSTERINESDEMREVMQAYSKKREVSAQECVCRATGIHMKQSSRSVIFVPTDDNPVKMSRPLSYLESTTNDSLNIWMTSLTDKYKARPETPEFEEMCLADFASTCRIVYGKQTNGKGVLPLLNEMGFVQKRTSDKPAVIRYHRCSKEKNPEQYFGTMIKLYLPYRSDCELKSQHFPTYESFYECGTVRLPGSEYSDYVKNIVKENRDKYEKNSEEIDEALEEYEENRDEVDEWCNLNPQSEMVRVPCDQGAESDHEHQENVPDLNRSEVVVPEVRLTRQPPAIEAAELQRMYRNLNQKQTCVFYKIRDWCLKRVCGLNPEQLFLYINGGAGTGKSLLIRCLYSMASKILSRMPRHADEPDISNPTVLLTSFTGTAAYNINGTTLHSLLKLPRSLKPPFQGLGNQLDEVRAELLNAEIIIIDEVSMVSKPLFAYVDARLKQIKGIQRPFGGMSVIAVGDFYQLPPVRQSKPLCVYDPSQLDLWQENFQMITLTEIMRQKDDTAFAEMLNRIRVKEKSDVLSDADRALLAQTITEPENCPLDALHIFATNKQVSSHNSVTLSRLHANTIEIPADDFKKDPRTGRMARLDKPFKGGKNELADTITVAEGARVMLTRNIDVHNGLVNGAFGKLVNVITSDSDQRVIKVGLKMDNDTAGGQSDNVVYVERVEENLKQKGVVRRQFPVKLAYACTIHKVQGMTTTKAVVSLKHVFEAGMSYVAISRVTSLNGLFLLDFDESKIYANTEVTAALDTMRQANLDDMMPLLLLKDTVSRPETMTIIHHNTEGLPAHICDIKNHHELHLADVLCLTETHLQGSFVAESLHLEGYSMFSRNRYLSYTNHPQLAKRRGGGVAIYVRNHITVTEKRYINNVTDLEFVVLKVEAPVTAFIVSVYRPPDYCLTSFLTNLESLLYSLELLEIHPIIVSGDFNVNVLVDKNTPVLQLFQTRGYAQVITEATTEKNTLLDLMFVSRPQQCLQSGTMKSYYSYHEPVFCIMSFDR
ncbi:uncharacterized protein LOC112138269 [Oryzias melastigma]|uniref:uncharacterized protein LOC112138269 n=1 Tax=Oryzias melastigma TaxID=30732 RepID=UPI000CF7D9B5|nr:uncharacterized protein LOC112138269 [Oryzias melastigma]